MSRQSSSLLQKSRDRWRDGVVVHHVEILSRIKGVPYGVEDPLSANVIIVLDDDVQPAAYTTTVLLSPPTWVLPAASSVRAVGLAGPGSAAISLSGAWFAGSGARCRARISLPTGQGGTG